MSNFSIFCEILGRNLAVLFLGRTSKKLSFYQKSHGRCTPTPQLRRPIFAKKKRLFLQKVTDEAREWGSNVHAISDKMAIFSAFDPKKELLDFGPKFRKILKSSTFEKWVTGLLLFSEFREVYQLLRYFSGLSGFFIQACKIPQPTFHPPLVSS